VVHSERRAGSVPTASDRALLGQQRLRVEVCDVGWKTKMFNGRSRGPKPSKWTGASQMSFKSFFARRSEPLKAAADDQPLMTAGALKWMSCSFGDEPRQVRADVGAPIRSVALCLTGTLVALGIGEAPGQGTCERYWVGDEQEVPEGTDGASARVRGGTGDLQLRMANGTLAWFSGAHCRPWIAEDGALPACFTATLPQPPVPASGRAQAPDGARAGGSDVGVPSLTASVDGLAPAWPPPPSAPPR